MFGAMTHGAPDDSGRASERSVDRTVGSGFDRSADRKGVSDAYGALSLVIAGVLVWGAVGWLVSTWLDNRVFLMIGLLLGMGAGLYLVWFRYGRPQ